MQSFDNKQQIKDTGLSKFTALVYLYTGLGMAFWLLSAFGLAKNPAISIPFLKWSMQHSVISTLVMIFVPIMLLYLCNAFARTSYFMTFVCYLAFLFTLSFSGLPMFYVYSPKSIIQAISMSAITFVIFAAYGYFTKSDLMSWGKILSIGLIAIIVISLLDIFLFKSPMVELFINIISIVIFLALIAFDSQNLKRIYFVGSRTSSNLGGLALMASIDLILDLINLIMSFLAIFGNSDNNN